MSAPGPGTRQRNLGTLLQLLHRSGPLSRASLTESTGLNRSTVADLVGQLSALGLVREGEPHRSRRVGRPSPVVEVDPRVCALTANPEVDALTLAIVGLDQRVIVRERIEHESLPDPEATAELVGDRLRHWQRAQLSEHRLMGVGVAVPGLVRASDGLVREAPHLRWRDAPLRDLITASTGLPTEIGNDASLGAHAEHLFGAGRGVDNLVYLNGGASGIGGGLVVGGALVGGAHGYAGEFGQNRPGIAAPDDRRAPAGVLEDEVNRAHLLQAVGLQAADEPTLAAALSASPEASVHEELARQRRILSTALANAVNVLNPSVIVLGGFLSTVAASGMDDLYERMRAQAMPASTEGLQVRLASLAEDRLLIGAAELVFADLLHAPAAAAPGEVAPAGVLA